MAEKPENLPVTSPFTNLVAQDGDPVVYRNMTKAQLFAEYNPWYNPYDKVDVFPDGGTEWWSLVVNAAADYTKKCENKEIEECAEVRLGVKYGSSDRETLDIFIAKDREKAPIHFFIHGGYWVMENLQPPMHFGLAQKFIASGATVVFVNYDLVPKVTIPEIIDQVRSGLAYTYKNAAKEHFGDPERIFVSGHSAGGHLAGAMVGTRWTDFDKKLPATVVKACCPISGVVDLGAIPWCPFVQNMRLDPNTVQSASPIYWRAPTTARVCMTVGEKESIEFHRMSEEQARNWERDGAPTEVLKAPANHFTILFELLDDNSPMLKKFLAYIHEVKDVKAL